MLGAAPAADMVVAICDDKYRANYPRAYLAAHHPLLVLRDERASRRRAGRKNPRNTGYDMGPYMISHAKFTPSFKILSHSDEAQIPWGVVRLEFRDEKAVFGAIAPRGPHAQDTAVQDGLPNRAAELLPLPQHGRARAGRNRGVRGRCWRRCGVGCAGVFFRLRAQSAGKEPARGDAGESSV